MHEQDLDTHLSRKQKDAFHIVGVGVSAGGLQALTQLFEHTPADIGMAFVVLQHLDPTKKSLLPETLARTTSLPVKEAKDGTKIIKNRIYTMPSESYMTIVGNKLRLDPRKKSDVTHKPIDTFFESLAKNHGKDAVGIVLSGTGSDGTAGIQAIKASGGMTFAQDDSAQFKDMPNGAIASGSVDFILSPDRIATKLSRLAASSTTKAKSEINDIGPVLHILRAKTGIDFSEYKQTSVNRRIQRRMAFNHIKTAQDYAAFLAKNPNELEKLHKDMLINVTSFFREPEQFETLQESVFPALLKNRSSKKPIRVWVPGCATGEEAYSIAIALQEFMASTLDKSFAATRPTIHILGTDIAKDAVAEASKGIYGGELQSKYHQSVCASFSQKFLVGTKSKNQFVLCVRLKFTMLLKRRRILIMIW